VRNSSCWAAFLFLFSLSNGAWGQLVPANPTAPNGTTGVPVPATSTKEPPRPEVQRASGSADVDPSTYKIGALDEVRIDVWREPDLSGIHKVRPDGKITLPFIGELAVVDMTPDQMKESLVKGFSSLVNQPQVMVQVVAVRSKRYFLVGKFVKVGELPIERNITVMEAIAAAGGFQPFANQSKVVILREGSGGVKERLKFNYKEVLKGKKLEQNILIKNGDYVIAQ
jgi:polysaccharide biosynthesis/export protein